MKILIVQLRQLGDILLTTPVMRALRESYDGAEIHVLTYPMGKLILPGNPNVTKHLIAPQSGFFDLCKFLMNFRHESYDVVIDFMSTPRSALMSRFARSARRISYDTSRGFLFTDVVSRKGESSYIVKEKFRLLTPLGLTPSDVRLDLPWSSKDVEVTQKFFAQSDRLLTSKRRVLLSPTHRRMDRKWPWNEWMPLARWLERDQKAEVLWAWGPGESEEIDAIMAMDPGIGTKIPRTTFKEFAALIANCDLFIGNSNGPSHLAVVVNTPSIQLHGHTKLVCWSPMTNRHRGIECDPMTTLKIADIQKLILEMWPMVDLEAIKLRNVGYISDDRMVWSVRPDL